MTENKSGENQSTEHIREKEDFVSYLKVLFPLIEGSASPEGVRPELEKFLEKHCVPADIESMLKELFMTKFNESL